MGLYVIGFPPNKNSETGTGNAWIAKFEYISLGTEGLPCLQQSGVIVTACCFLLDISIRNQIDNID